MSIFPFINGDDGLHESTKNDLPLYKECAWDFVTDRAIFVDGKPKIVYENEALKVWMYKAIKTNRYEFGIYTWNYGCEIISLIGKGFEKGLIQSEARRYVEEALYVNPYIVNIYNVDVRFVRDTLTVEATVESIYGTVNIIV